MSNVNLAEIVGKGYKQFWNFKGRYRLVKGSRGSKKSCTASIWYIYNMMKYYHQYGLKPNVMVVRRYFNTHRDSTYKQLKWAINRLGVDQYWKATVNPLEITYVPSGQKYCFVVWMMLSLLLLLQQKMVICVGYGGKKPISVITKTNLIR